MAKKIRKNTKSVKPAKVRKAARSPRPAQGAVPRGTAGRDVARGGHIEVIARGVLLRGSRVLLCQNLKHGYLYLPGGHVEFGESAAAAVEREFLEETGQRVRAKHLLLVDEGVFDTGKSQHHEINFVFHVEHHGEPSRPIVSQEAHLGFVWLELAAVTDSDIRPLSAKAFLVAGPRQGDIGMAPHAGAEWVSAIHTR